jgi:imidazoleglycerol phosphate synthase glutamine amidotransferase subunit HisH
MAKTGFIDYQTFLGIVLGIQSLVAFSLEKFNSKEDQCHFLYVELTDEGK